jgi:hypothetical protein
MNTPPDLVPAVFTIVVTLVFMWQSAELFLDLRAYRRRAVERDTHELPTPLPEENLT